MEITFLGAAGTVTGSRYLIQSEKRTHAMVDCGLFQGLKVHRLKNWNFPNVDLDTLRAIFLTHAHIDHSGYLPLFRKRGYQGPIHCTEATAALCKILLPDAGRIQEEDAAYANKKGYSKHHPAEPLFSEKDAFSVFDLFQTHAFKLVSSVSDLKFQFWPAGHILGAGSVRIESHKSSVTFSGDLGRDDDFLMYPPEIPPPSDWVVMEGTYGDRIHPPENPLDRMQEVIQEVASQGGKVLIPAFAVGRAQALLHLVHQLIKKKKIPNLPIYLDSPMASNVTQLYQRFSEEHRLDESDVDELFQSVIFISSQQESIELSRSKGPGIIISASGMLTGGRVLHHLAHLGPDPRNGILLAGFQAPGTRGAALLEGTRRLKVHGMYVPIDAGIYSIQSLSAHADQRGLIRWAKRASQNARGIILVHGEDRSLDTLRMELESELKLPIIIPEQGQTLKLT